MRRSNSKLCKNVRSYFREYCNATSIHGFRYFGERRSYTERGWWFVVFVVCLSVCGYFITIVYDKWENSPVIVSISTKEKPIYEIPFPAVTVCPETKSFKEYYRHSEIVTKLLHEEELTLQEYQNASYMNLICDFNVGNELFREYNKSGFNSSLDNEYHEDNNFFEFLYDVMPNRSDILLGCRWMNQDCDDLFRPIITDEGICYTFNMLDHTEIYKNTVFIPNVTMFDSKIAHKLNWTLDEGYTVKDVDTYPKRALLSGLKNSLELLLIDFSVNADPICKLSRQGFKVSLHTSMRIPRPSQQHFRVPLNEEVLVAVQPVMITTSTTVKDFKPDKRECYFQTDKPLKYFEKYSQLNCNLECLTNFTIYWCDCVNYFMPRENGTDICGTLNDMCMAQAEEFLQEGHLRGKLKGKKQNQRKRKQEDTQGPPSNEDIEEMADCNCLPLCSDLSYNVEISSSQWEWKNYLKAINVTPPEETLGPSISRLVIYFKNSQFVTSKRHELYGPTEFLGNFGGLLGLFTGFSILSLMELIYFLTVRIIFNIRLYGKWSGSDKE